MTANQKNSRLIEIRQLVMVLIVAFILRLVFALFETEVGVDSVHYILMGDNIAHGRGFATWNTTGGQWILPPTFPILIAFFSLFGSGLEWSGHLAAIVAGTFLLVPVYYLTRRIFGVQTAKVAILLAAFTPILVDYSVVILTELLFAGFAIWMMVLIHRAFSENGKLLDSFWSGILAGLAFLTKTFGLFLVPFLILAYLFGKGGYSKNAAYKQAVLSLVGFLILAVPYWIALHQFSGEWTIDGKGTGQESRIFAANLTEEHIDPRYSGELTDDGSDFLINAGSLEPGQPGGFFVLTYVKKYIQKLIRIYQDFPFTPTYPNGVLLFYLFPAMLLGIGFFTGRGKWSERDSDRFLLYWLCPFVFCIPLIFVEVRYFIPVVPLLIPFMARGGEEIAGWIFLRFPKLSEKTAKPFTKPALTIVVAVFILLAIPKITYKMTHWGDPMVSYNPREIAAQYLLDNGFEPERIMEYAHSVSFYSGAQSILVPDGDLDDVITIARKYDVELLSLDEFYMLRSHRRPEIEYLFETNITPPNELELIYVDYRYSGLKHVIYRIRPPGEITGAESVEDW